jgi:hypothetical protein
MPRQCVESWVILGLFTALLTPESALAQPDEALRTDAPPTNILPLDQIRIGMKGYGLTVFHGWQIEPFDVEVVSVMRDFGPKHGVIWIVCPEPRMQHSGPVMGMSGSPIYLWDDDADAPGDGEAQRVAGEGGKLIGAFALGFSLVKTCYAGVQPIEQMREVGSRAIADQGAGGHAAGAADPGRTLAALLAAGRADGLAQPATWRAAALLDLVTIDRPLNPSAATQLQARAAAGLPFGAGGSAVPMKLPLAVHPPAVRRLLGPALEQAGLMPVAAGAVSGKPPPGVDPGAIRMEPGSVLAIPLVWGDMDMTVTGTCTEVLPDGRVLGFGHGFMGNGSSALPLATGYVHMIVPRIDFSFKLGGSAVLQEGAIVRDELAAVAGALQGSYRTAPLQLAVTLDDGSHRAYSYTVAQHRSLSPMLTAVAAFRSVIAERNPPVECTQRIRGSVSFEGGRRLAIDTIVPDSSPLAIAFAVLPPLSIMANNPFETVMATGVDLAIEIEPAQHSATLLHARADRTEYAPADEVAITITYQPYRKEKIDRRLTMKLPRKLPDGNYAIQVSSGGNYFQRMMRLRPHLTQATRVDDLFDLLERMSHVQDNALYLTLELPDQGIAVEREELPKLPSSRLALMTTPMGPPATPFVEWVQKKVTMDNVFSGEQAVAIRVREDLLTP